MSTRHGSPRPGTLHTITLPNSGTAAQRRFELVDGTGKIRVPASATDLRLAVGDDSVEATASSPIFIPLGSNDVHDLPLTGADSHVSVYAAADWTVNIHEVS